MVKLEVLLAICLLDYYADTHCVQHSSTLDDHTKIIQIARYIMRVTDYASVSSISVLPLITGMPFSNIKSTVDGSVAKSTGIPYFYLSPIDVTARDLSKNASCTVLLSLEENGFCEKTQTEEYDDPRCARLILTGKMRKVKEGTKEHKFAKYALFERHPAMASFPKGHKWFVAKLHILHIALVDWIGRVKFLRVNDYLLYRYPGNTVIEKFLMPQTFINTAPKQTTHHPYPIPVRTTNASSIPGIGVNLNVHEKGKMWLGRPRPKQQQQQGKRVQPTSQTKIVIVTQNNDVPPSQITNTKAPQSQRPPSKIMYTATIQQQTFRQTSPQYVQPYSQVLLTSPQGESEMKSSPPQSYRFPYNFDVGDAPNITNFEENNTGEVIDVGEYEYNR